MNLFRKYKIYLKSHSNDAKLKVNILISRCSLFSRSISEKCSQVDSSATDAL